MLRVVLLFLTFTVFVAGCSSLTLPSPGSSKTLLIVPADIKNSSAEDWSNNFRMVLSRYSDGGWEAIDEMLPDYANPYIILSDLPPGRYKFHAIGWRTRTMWRIAGGGSNYGKTNFEPVYFDLAPQTATILDREIIILQTEKRGGTSVLWKVKALSPDRSDQIKRQVEQSNNHGWAIAG